MIGLQRFKDQINLKVFKNIFNNCLGVGGEKVLIVGDYGTQNRLIAPILTNAYAMAARDLNLNYSVFLQHSKARGDFADEVLLATLRRLPDRSVIVLNVSNRIGKLGSLGLSFRKFCNKHNHKFITSSSLGGLSNDMLKDVLKTLDVDYDKMTAKGEKIKRILDTGREVNIRTKAGTDLTMNIRGVKAIVNSGSYTRPGAGGNMPTGEIYMYPVEGKTEGVVVVDGSIRLKDKTLLVRNPVTLNVENGKITKISNNYEGHLFKSTLEWAHKTSRHPETIRKIAELGIGINPNAKVIGATIIDEKAHGTVHIANGSNSWFGGSIYSIIHLDHVIRNARVRVDGRLLMLD